MSARQKTKEAAKGKWKEILIELGVPEDALQNRHGPCPLCGGKDRFRWDNKERRGTFFCNQCGAGDGMDLAVQFTGTEFATVAARIDSMLGNIRLEDPTTTKRTSDATRRKRLREIYRGSAPVSSGDLVDRYLASRKLAQTTYPKALRFHAALNDGEGGDRPAMLAAVGLPGEKLYRSFHRTFLKPDGSGKADMANPRKLTPGALPDGACIVLAEYFGGVLGIAEGIETALAASALFEVPVWAAVNCALLRKWEPPIGCNEVVIFGDNDTSMAGQSAAYELARRIKTKGLTVDVQIPQQQDTDWADQLMSNSNLEHSSHMGGAHARFRP